MGELVDLLDEADDRKKKKPFYSTMVLRPGGSAYIV